MHKPSGLGVYAMDQWEKAKGSQRPSNNFVRFEAQPFLCRCSHCLSAVNIDLSYGGGAAPFVKNSRPDTNVWYVKPFWRKTWTPAGATTLFGEYGQYNDQFAAGTNAPPASRR